MGATRKTAIPKSSQGCVLRATEENRKLCWGEGVRRGHPGGDLQTKYLEDKWQDLTSKKKAHGSIEHKAKPTKGKGGRLDHWSRILEVQPGQCCYYLQGSRGCGNLPTRMSAFQIFTTRVAMQSARTEYQPVDRKRQESHQEICVRTGETI